MSILQETGRCVLKLLVLACLILLCMYSYTSEACMSRSGGSDANQDSLSRQIGTLQQKLTELDNTLNIVNDDVTRKINFQEDVIIKNNLELEQKIETQQQNSNKKLSQVTQQSDKYFSLVDTMKSQVENCDKQIDNMVKKIKVLEESTKKISELQQKIERQENTYKELNQVIGKSEEFFVEVNTLKTSLEDCNTNYKQLQEKQKMHTERQENTDYVLKLVALMILLVVMLPVSYYYLVIKQQAKLAKE